MSGVPSQRGRHRAGAPGTAAPRRPSSGAASDDRDVLERLRAGDEALFREVVVALNPVLMRLARTYTSNAQSAQDAVQDTWLVVVDSLDSFEGRSSLKTWVCGILVNKARRTGVKDARVLPFSSAWRDEHAPAVEPSRFHTGRDGAPAGTWSSPPHRWDTDPEDRLAAGELRQVIDAAIAALPARQREVITARDVLGLDADEAAEVLGLSAGNQRVLLHRARSRVRAALEAYAVDARPEPPAAALPRAGSTGRASPGRTPSDDPAPPAPHDERSTS